MNEINDSLIAEAEIKLYNRIFIYSKEQFKFRYEIEKAIGRKFFPGKIVVGGEMKNFTQIVSDMKEVKFSDANIIATGDIRKLKYEDPFIE